MRATNIKICFLISAILCTAAAAKIIYVDDNATGTNNGSSWTDAYVYLQEALADAKDSEKPVEIRVAQGTYKPNGGIVTIPEFDWRTLTFQLISGVSLKGGYAGTGSPDPNARDINLYETILSGDLASDDNEVTDIWDLRDDPTRAENSYHVVTSSETDETSVLDGFTVTAGNANGPYPNINGGGMYNNSSITTVINCTFSGNSAKGGGGGMYNIYGGLRLTNCTFVLNSAQNGGGIYCRTADTIITDCLIASNTVTGSGGGISFTDSNLTVTGCTIRNNYANSAGGVGIGAIDGTISSLTMINSFVTGNKAENLGGGIFCQGDTILLNCIIFGNHAGHSGGGIFFNYTSRVTNSIIYGNTSRTGYELDQGAHGAAGCRPESNKITYSVVGGDSNAINIPRCYSGNWLHVDPLFASPGYWADANDPDIVVEPNDPNAVWVDGDYHLKSQAGRWDPNSGSWIADDVTSPCINSGDPNSPVGDEPEPNGSRINMGAYGGTAEASMSPHQSMPLPRIAYIYNWWNNQAAESFRAFLAGRGCLTTLIELNNVPAIPFDSYDLIIVANITQNTSTWSDPEIVAAIDNSGKPIVGLGEGGYYFFGVLGLSIGNPHGAHASNNSITVLDPNSPLFRTPYPIDIPDDRILQLYTETETVSIYLWPEVPETVTALGMEANNTGYYPLVMEHNRYLLWGFTESPQKMTEVGKILFINVVIRAANSAW